MKEGQNTAGGHELTGLEIAVIGMAGRFPGAASLGEFWDNLKNGVETISFFSDEELTAAGIDPGLLANPNYVKAKGVLEEFAYFDSSFFDYLPAEAELMDPQVRIFHEIAWEALEEAGYDPDRLDGLIGIYAGAGHNHYWEGLAKFSGKSGEMGHWRADQLLDKDYMSMEISYKLNLSGPAFSIYAACSTSLVAVHLACQALLNGECDIALAGGVTLHLPDKAGFMYREGMIMSPDGHCRAFDAKARGTIPGNGAGIVILKLFQDAAADRDHIYAVVKGSAINNDGLRKGVFTAPALEGQADAIRTAFQAAHVEPGSISCVETHGTGTPFGDSIEIEALKLAFENTEKNSCAIASVKSSIGHLDTAAGVAGLIKTVLALKHRLIPASLHVEHPNPEIDFENSPFYVNTTLKEWKNNGTPLRAGVSSFGIGGTNAHIILEEAPQTVIGPSSLVTGENGKKREHQLILLSAKTGTALEKMTKNLADYFRKNPGINLADAAYTLQVGRKEFQHRKTLVCSTLAEAIRALESDGPPKARTFFLKGKATDRPVVFMFPGLGAQYMNMSWDLYRQEAVFREETDRCFAILDGLVDFNLKDILYPYFRSAENRKSSKSAKSSKNSDSFEVAQLLLFIVEYALAGLLIKWGIKPGAMIGYSIGEYTAACLAGVFTLEEALKLLVTRGRLIEALPRSAMLSVPLTGEKLKPFLGNVLSLAIDNGSSCIAAGPEPAINTLAAEMKKNKVLCMRLPASHAIHSRMMEPLWEKFAEEVGRLDLKEPQIPYISNVTGTWATGRQTTDPAYWATHLRSTVRFDSGIKQLLKEPGTIFLEIGPGHDLSTLVKRYIDDRTGQTVINLVRSRQQEVPDTRYLYNKIGGLWLYGKTPDWSGFHGEEKRCRIPLPTYAFERQPFLLIEKSSRGEPGRSGGKPGQTADLADWFYIPTWTRLLLLSRERQPPGPSPWLVFLNETGSLGLLLVDGLKREGYEVLVVKKGSKFSREEPGVFRVNHRQEKDYRRLFQELASRGITPAGIVHLWSLDRVNPGRQTRSGFENTQADGFYSLLPLTAAMEEKNLGKPFQVNVLTSQVQDVNGEEQLCPGKATVMAPLKILPQEHPGIKCRGIDVVTPAPGSPQEQELADRLLTEILTIPGDTVVAYRGNYRWVQDFKPLRLEKPAEKPAKLKEKGVYLIIGGLGKIGLMVAEYLAKEVKAKLILTGRTALPARQAWDEWLSAHDRQDPASQKIRSIKKLEALEAEVLVTTVEAADKHQMKRLITRAEESFGPLNGIIHSAGIMRGPSLRMIRELKKEQCRHQFRPKVDGCFILEALLQEKELDFCLVISSLSAVLGGLRFAAYAAANMFMDAFVNRHNRHHPVKWTSVDWEGMDPQETHLCLQRLFALENVHQVVVSKGGNLQTRINRWIKLETLEKKEQEDAAAAKGSPARARPELMNPCIQPRNALEQTLVEIWQDFFGMKPLGIQDDFFEIGGDSLKAITMIALIHRKLSVSVSISDFFNRPTIEKLAPSIAHEDKTAYTPIDPVEKKEYYPLSAAQRRLYFLQQMNKESLAYNEGPLTVLLEGKPEKERLESTFREMIARHESLRTSIRMIHGEPAQVIHREVEFEIEDYDADQGQETRGNQEELRLRSLIENVVRPFDLSHAPLLRAGLIEGKQGFFLVLDLHHIVTDGVSQEIFIKEFKALYGEKKLPALRLSYKDYSVWQKKFSRSAELKKQENYWLKQFGGEVPILDLPSDYERGEIPGSEGKAEGFELDKTTAQQLIALARSEGATLFMILLAIFNILLAKLARQEDIVVGAMIAGRNRDNLENIIGMFVSALALRNYPKGEQTFSQFLAEVKKRSLEAFENQEYQYDDLVSRVVVQRDMNRLPLCSVGFSLQNLEIEKHKSANPKVYPYQNKTAKGDIGILGFVTGERLFFSMEYAATLFKKERIKRFIKYFKEIIAAILKNKETTLKDIKISHELFNRELDIPREINEDFVF